MSLLATDFREEMQAMAKKFKDPGLCDEQGYPISYPTGFFPFDYRNGLRVYTSHMTEDVSYVYDSIGIGEGSIVMVIGKTGTAKTTWVIQTAAGIVQRFPNSVIIHDDIESGTNKSRISNITGWDSRRIQNQYILRDKGINSDNFFTRVKTHCDRKVELAEKMPNELTYFTGIIDIYGKPVYQIIPTVYILDSLPLLVPKDMTEEEKIAGNMSAAQVAKLNTQTFKRLTPELKKANVILFVINHINQNININPFAPKQAQINYLKQDEVLPGRGLPVAI